MGTITISIRVDSEWYDFFKKTNPKTTISEVSRALLYRFYPVNSNGVESARYNELIQKANELSNQMRILQLKQEENDVLILKYEKGRNRDE